MAITIANGFKTHKLYNKIQITYSIYTKRNGKQPRPRTMEKKNLLSVEINTLGEYIRQIMTGHPWQETFCLELSAQHANDCNRRFQLGDVVARARGNHECKRQI